MSTTLGCNVYDTVKFKMLRDRSKKNISTLTCRTEMRKKKWAWKGERAQNRETVCVFSICAVLHKSFSVVNQQWENVLKTCPVPSNVLQQITTQQEFTETSHTRKLLIRATFLFLFFPFNKCNLNKLKLRAGPHYTYKQFLHKWRKWEFFLMSCVSKCFNTILLFFTVNQVSPQLKCYNQVNYFINYY